MGHRARSTHRFWAGCQVSHSMLGSVAPGPYCLAELLTGDYPPPVAQQVVQHRPGLGSERHLFAAAPELARNRVEAKGGKTRGGDIELSPKGSAVQFVPKIILKAQIIPKLYRSGVFFHFAAWQGRS